MYNTIMLEVFVDLVLEDVLNDGHLFEANPYHDASGKFTSKDAAKAYTSGAMAKGRAAGMKAKAQGLGHDQIRAAIKDAMQKHIEAGGTRAQGQGRLDLVRGKIAKGTMPGQTQIPGPTAHPATKARITREAGVTTVAGPVARVSVQTLGPRGEVKHERTLYDKPTLDKKLDRTLEKGKRIVDRERAMATARAAGIVGDMERSGYKQAHFNGKGTTFYQHPETKDTVMVSRFIEKGWMAEPDKHGVLIKRVDQSVMAAEKAKNAGAADRNELAKKELNDPTLSATRGTGKSFEPGDTPDRHPAVKAMVDAVKKAGAEGGSEAGQKEFVKQALGLLGGGMTRQQANDRNRAGDVIDAWVQMRRKNREADGAAAQPTVTIGKITRGEWEHEMRRVTQAMDRHGVKKAEDHLRRRLDAIKDPKKMVAAGMALENENFHGLAAVARTKAMDMGVSKKQAHAPEFAF